MYILIHAICILTETKGNDMTNAKFVIVRNADIDPNISDCNYQVALELNGGREYFYILDNTKKSDAQNLADLLNIKNNLIGN
jgi:hypothetical protein